MRRARGEGTISKRADGIWIGQITVGRNEEGKAVKRCVSAKTQKECKQKLDRLKSQYHYVATLPQNYNGKMQYVDFLLYYWLPEKRNVERIEETTLATHTQRIDKWIKPFFANTSIEKIDGKMLMDFYGTMDKLNPITVKKIHVIINNSLKKAVRDGLIQYNPASVVRLPKMHFKEKRSLTDEEVVKLLDAAKEYSICTARNKNIYPLIVLGLTSGLRCGELLGLTWDNIDFQRNTITVEKAVARLTGKIIVKRTKTDASKRTIAVSAGALDILKVHKEIYATGDWVFPSIGNKENPQSPQGIARVFTAVANLAGVDCTLHLLRHTNITNMIIAGTNLKTVKQRAGHSSLATTMSYTHPSEKQDREAADIFEKFV